MSINPLLEPIPASELENLISLPYRVGIWISEADDEDGEWDDEEEHDALQGILNEIADLHADTPIVQALCQETVRAQESWGVWHNHIFTILEDSARAIHVLDTHVSRQCARNFRAALLEIATTVAQAWGEFGEDFASQSTQNPLKSLAKSVIGKFRKLSTTDKNHPANISPAEHSLLSRLHEALAIPEK